MPSGKPSNDIGCDSDYWDSDELPLPPEKPWPATSEKALAARHEANGAWKRSQVIAKAVRGLAFEIRHEPKLDVAASLEALASELESG